MAAPDAVGDVLNSGEPGFVITRSFAAPRELVFKAWTELERLLHWWGPAGATLQIARLELRPGGEFRYSTESPAGRIWGKFVYRENVPPQRLVFVNAFTDAEGRPIRNPWSPAWPLQVLNTLTLIEQGGMTLLTLQGGPLNATVQEQRTFEEGRESIRQGFAGTLDQLAAYLARALDLSTP